MKLHNIKKMVILFSGESVHHPKDRGGLEFNAGERGDCIQKDDTGKIDDCIQKKHNAE